VSHCLFEKTRNPECPPDMDEECRSVSVDLISADQTQEQSMTGSQLSSNLGDKRDQAAAV